MDVLRSCNVLRTRFVADSDALFPCRWFLTEDDAPPYPGWHAFGHPSWEGEWPDEFEGPGCLWKGAQWRSNKLPHVSSYVPIGTPEEYQDGIAYLGAPAEELCGVPIIAPQGGAAAGGSGFTPAAALSFSACGCGVASSTVRLSARSIACGCGASRSAFTARYSAAAIACGCGDTVALARPSYPVAASACGCGSASSEAAEIVCLVRACGCGSASSTQTTGGIVVPCASFPIANPLNLVVIGEGDCSCLNYSGPMLWDENNRWWASYNYFSCGNVSNGWLLRCWDASEGWVLRSIMTADVPVSQTADTPFRLSFAGSINPVYCVGTFTAEITS